MNGTQTIDPPDQASSERIAVEQFTQHARSFAAAPLVNDVTALAVLDRLAMPGPGDRVVDVACGPGVVASHLADSGAHVVGVDLTPRMVELADRRAAERGVGDRCAFRVGRMEQTGLETASFSIAVSRYALHHAVDPSAVATELVRMTRPGGRIVVVDFAAVADADVARAYDDAERMRDPSHIRNLTADEQRRLFEQLGCRVVRREDYRLTMRLDLLLAGSHGHDHEGMRRAFEASLSTHRLGVDARRTSVGIVFEYPIAGWTFER